LRSSRLRGNPELSYYREDAKSAKMTELLGDELANEYSLTVSPD
jgi:hypothetical protein